MANIDKVTLNGTDYTIVDSTVPSWAKNSTKPTYNGGEIKYTGTTGNVVTNNTTLNTAVQALDTAVNNRLKYVLLSQAEYDNLATKDSGTLYLIGGTKYTITLTGSGVSSLYNISVNGESKTTSDFPLEVNEGSSLGFKHIVDSISCTVTMDGTDITNNVRTFQNEGDGPVTIPIYVYDISNITGDIVVTINSNSGGGSN